MGMEIAGVPKAVHGAFILGSPVDARPNGAGPVAAGDRITGFALRDIPSRVVVLFHRDPQALLNQVHKFRAQPSAVLIKALLMKSSTLVERYGIGRIGELGKHSGDID